MTKGEAIKKVEEFLASMPDGVVIGSTLLPPYEALKRVVREAKANGG